MASNARQKIKQTRGVLIIVVLACLAKLVKTIKDGDGETAQIVVLALVIVILGVILAFYSWIGRYTQKEQETYGQPQNHLAQTSDMPKPPPKGFKAVTKEIFKNQNDE